MSENPSVSFREPPTLNRGGLIREFLTLPEKVERDSLLFAIGLMSRRGYDKLKSADVASAVRAREAFDVIDDV